MSEQEQEQPAAKKVRWWRRQQALGPRGQAISLWLLTGVALAGHLTHTKMNFNQGGIGPDEPVTWWIVAFWAVTAAFATFRWLRSRRHPAEPEPESQPPQPTKAQQHAFLARIWQGTAVLWLGIAVLLVVWRSNYWPAWSITSVVVAGLLTGLSLWSRAKAKKGGDDAEVGQQAAGAAEVGQVHGLPAPDDPS